MLSFIDQIYCNIYLSYTQKNYRFLKENNPTKPSTPPPPPTKIIEETEKSSIVPIATSNVKLF